MFKEAMSTESGVAATGQSSWGPTVFAVTRDEESAEELAVQLTSRGNNTSAFVTTADNRGVRIEPVSAR
ncbi:MAG: hypothetical protein AAF456_17655 [Planctomycetota bacterium]